MAVTVVQHTEIFGHVMKLIGNPADGSGSISTMLSANDIATILDICKFSLDAIRSLAYKLSNKEIELSKGHQTLLRIIGHYRIH